MGGASGLRCSLPGNIKCIFVGAFFVGPGWPPDLLLRGNTPVASVLAEGTRSPRSELLQLRKTQYPFFRKDPYAWPRFGGAFLCVQTLGTISRVPGFALVRKNGTLRE